MKELRLNTVCEEARCPNIGECWNHGTATFMILGDVCTRACGYCAVPHGMPTELDAAEPARVAHAVASMGLQYVVITSVDRDDVTDGGAAIFAETIRAVRAARPECRVEVLIPDFQGLEGSAADRARRRPRRPEPQHRDRAAALSSGPARRPLSAHARTARSGAHHRAAHPHQDRPDRGPGRGVGRARADVDATFAASACEILTIGQYLRPTESHLRMARYYHPDEFARAQAHRARPGLRPRRVRAAGPQFVSCPRAGGRACRRARLTPPFFRITARRRRWPPCIAPSSRAIAARGCGATANASPSRSARRFATRSTGAARSPASAIPTPACSSSAWRRRRTAPIEQDACSPAMASAARATSCSRRCTPAGSPTSPSRGTSPTDSNCATPSSLPPSAARRPTTSRRPKSSRAARPTCSRSGRRCPTSRAVLCLGKLAWDACWRALALRGHHVPRPRPPFEHGASVRLDDGFTVLGAYHPSRQNTHTGRLTARMLAEAFATARKAIDDCRLTIADKE